MEIRECGNFTGDFYVIFVTALAAVWYIGRVIIESKNGLSKKETIRSIIAICLIMICVNAVNIMISIFSILLQGSISYNAKSVILSAIAGILLISSIIPKKKSNK